MMSLTSLWKDFEDLDVCKDIFKDVKFYVSGDVKSNVLDLLRCCGAERMNYFSDYVTHLICGEEPEETDLSDANDLYEIPALTVKWIFMCVKLKKLCSTKPYIYNPNKLFSNLTFCFSDVGKDRLSLWGIITYNGGVVHLNLDKNCTHLITTSTTSEKFVKAESLGQERIVIVTPDWVTESVRNKCLEDVDVFHPSLIDWPKVIKHESTTAITGFEPEQSELDEKALQITAPDSTQALLDKLKQRMPWNQTTCSEVAPPNVVAPSYTNAKSDVSANTSQSQRFNQQNQISLQKAVPTSFPNTQPINFMQPNQVPRSIVHHTPQSTHESQFSQSVSYSQANLTNSQKINRALEQFQQQHQRSNLQLNRLNQINPQGPFNPLQRNRVVQVNPLNQENQMNQVRPHAQPNQLQLPTSTQPNLLQNQLGQGNLLQSNQIQRQLSQMEQQGSINQMQISPNQLQQHISQMNKATGNNALNQLTQQQLLNRQLQNQQLLKNQQNQLTQQQLNQNPLAQQPNPNQQISDGPLTQQLGQNQLVQQQISQNPIDRQSLGQQQLVQQQIIKNQLNQQQISQNLVAQQISQNQQLRERQLTQQLNANQLGQQQINPNQLAQQKLGQSQLDQQINQNQLSQQPISQSLNQQSINPNHLSQQSINQNQLSQQPINPNQAHQSIAQNQLSQHSINQPQLSQQPINQNPLSQQSINQNQLPQQSINQSQLSQQQINQNQLNQQINLTQLNQINQNQLNQQITQTRLNQQLNPSQLCQQQILQNQQMAQQQSLNQQQLLQNQLGQLNQQNQSNQLNQQQDQLEQLTQQRGLNQLNPQQLNQLNQLSQQHNQHGQLQHQNQPNPIAQNQLELNQQRQISQQIANQSNQIGQNLELSQQRQLIQQTQNQNSQANLDLNQTQLNQQRQLNQHLLQSRQSQGQNPPNPLAQMNQPNALGQQVSQPNQLGQQLNQNQINLQQNKLIQSQFNQQIVGQNQLGQQFVSSPGSQQFSQGGPHFGQTNQQNFNLNQQGAQQQLIQGPQVGQQLIKSQQQQQQQIVSQQQLVNQKLIGNQQQLLISQQQNQLQFNQGSNQPNQVAQPNLPNQPAQQRIGPPHLWQQQSQIIRQNVVQTPGGPRGQWPPNQQGVLQQRQFIQLDSQTHQQLQQMAPEQRTLFVAKLQRQRQLLQSRMQQQQQRGGHILIRGGPVPSGLSPQQQMQWLQQQANKQGIVFQQNIQQPNNNVPLQTNVTQNIQHTPGLSPIQQSPAFTEQNPQLQLQRQQQLRIQQYQLQREQAQKAIIQPPVPVQQANVVRPLSQPVDPNPNVDPNVQPNPLVVNPKTKTALANMLSIRLQSGGSTMAENLTEPSAAGTLRLMTAQHNAALNSPSRPQELLTLQQRRIINRPSADLIRPPPAPSVPPPNTGEPPKIPYSPRSTVPLQHRPGTYYGHNPNLKHLFLLGCVFVVVEVERFLEESTPGWQKKVEKHGGEIEKQYCNRVTHVICETQRHGVVMQALRDFKRCITLYWLSDVMIRKQVLPPWIALHLPTMYWDTPPGAKHLISLSGFDGTERDRVKHMIKYIGATLTTYFSKHNTLLIASKAEGPKYLHSKKWGIPVANIQWLTDVMLGHFSALSQMEHIKYQQFSDPPNFSFDPIMVPNLMHAWKMPINISQESYEKVKRSASPVVIPQKVKKLKTEHLTDENDNEEHTMSSATHRILFSMVPDANDLKNVVRQLGGSIAKSHNDCTHLVMSQLMRSNKLLHCICLGVYILPESWLHDSQKQNKFLDESNYSLDTKDFNSEFKCDFNATLSTKNRNKLFEGKYFYMTPSVFPGRKVLSELVQSCSGIVERNRRSSAQIEATNINSPYSYIILTHENDLHLVADLLKNNKDKVRIVCNVELILSAILRQTFEVEPYAVKIL